MSNTLKILMIGDIVARPGRRAVESVLPKIKEEEKIDLVIANAENLAGGRGVTAETLMQMMNAGVDYFTSGDHVFRQEGWEAILADSSMGLLRPANYLPSDMPGQGFVELEINGHSVVIVNIEGSEQMASVVNNPFLMYDWLHEDGGWAGKTVLVDFHAEVTSEKMAFSHYLDRRATAVFGTHTHVPTSDLQVLSGGTFHVSDVGMVGARDSVLGVKKEIIIRRFTETAKDRFVWEYSGEKIFNAVVIEVDLEGQIVGFSRIDRTIP